MTRTAVAELPMPQPETSRQPNHLIREKSPYLLQHAHNPVDWYPWGPEAIAKAKQEAKPIFLSIGYSTCHWCHVMERESFEDPQIAALLNRWFICVKVDREEHPDLDQVYMQAVMRLTGHGGWPLTAFLTPDLKPFFGGTYFPPERRWNLPGMTELLPAVAEAWAEKRHDLIASADQLAATLAEELAAPSTPGTISPQLLHEAFTQATHTFDATRGGFGSAPKFPHSPELSLLLRYWARSGTAQALEMVTATLDHLARGGIHDQLGGGFHRYSTDAEWLVPHFEKMLYDQALLSRTYLEAYRATRRAGDAEVARDIFEYVLRDLTDAEGGFYCAEDADSEGEEGKFYVWTPSQVIEALGSEEGELFNRFYGVTPAGNVEGHGLSILHLEQSLEKFASSSGLDPAALSERLARSRAKLFEARAHRVRPHRDEKILTSWNGLMIGSLASGASTLDEPRYLVAAQRAADFIRARLVRDGVLLRRYRDGEAAYPGTVEDYAFFADGLFELYEAGGQPRDLADAVRWTTQMVERFWDDEAGGFFLRGKDEPPLIVRSKEASDGATPSGNSMAAWVLLRLGHLTGNTRFESLGRQTLERFAPALERTPFGYPQMLIAADFALGPRAELVVAGEPDDARTTRLLRIIHERFLPRAITILRPDGAEGAAIASLAPAVASQTPVSGQPTAYVCQNFQCRLPTSDQAQLARLLDEIAAVPAP